jgi:DNA polymerase-3 subunit epsilon
MHLVYDTETSGFYNASLSLDHPQQGRVIQLAALLLDENLKEVSTFRTLIYPSTWVVSPGAQAVHGISIEMCEKYGMPIEAALEAFKGMFDASIVTVAHNHRFDSQMLTSEGFQFMNKKSVCTMDATTELCKIPHPKRSGYKWPKLSEALSVLLDIKLDNAHDALSDARGCSLLYKYLIDNGHLNIGASGTK